MRKPCLSNIQSFDIPKNKIRLADNKMYHFLKTVSRGIRRGSMISTAFRVFEGDCQKMLCSFNSQNTVSFAVTSAVNELVLLVSLIIRKNVGLS